MKNYILYFITFILSITLFTSINNWYYIQDEKNSNVHSERELIEALSTLQSQRYLLQNDEAYFDDSILQNNELLKKQLEHLKVHIDKKYAIINQIALDFLEHEQKIEDYISAQAIFHNSLFYLMEYSVKSNSKLSKRVKKVLYKYYHKQLNIEIEKNHFDKNSNTTIEEFLAKRHLYIFNTKQKEIKKIQDEHKQDKLLLDLQKLQKDLYARYDILELKSSNTLKYIAFSAILLILIIIVLFIQVNRALNSLKASNEDMQRVYGAFQKFTIFSRGDLNGNIIEVNDKFCELSGYKQEELVSKNFNILRLEKDEFFKDMWKTLKKQKAFHGVVTNRDKNGNKFYVDTIIVPILDSDGSTKEYINIQHDITELVEARDQAKASLKAKDAFMSSMSHELRTPLNSIIGFSTILQKKIEDEKLKSYAERVVDSSNSLLELINNILDLSKINSGNFKLDKYIFNLNSELQTLLANLSVQISNKNLHLNINFDYENGVVLKADFKRISQILNNLFSNALKFSEEGKNLYFSVSLHDDKLTFKVKDEGIGMSEEAQKRVFDAFEQADNSTTRKYGGTGLGLNITKSLVELMHGSVELKSQEGEGTEFIISIPVEVIEQENEEDIKEVEDDSYEPINAHALIVEDNKTNQMLLKLLLEDMGLTYSVANDGVEAVEMYEKEKFDIVLMDENMPNMNGTEAMQTIKNRHKDSCPIISLTANAMSEDREKFLNAGFDDYLSKPIDDKKLYEILKGSLQK